MRRSPEISIHVTAANVIAAAIAARVVPRFRYPFQASSTLRGRALLHACLVGRPSLLSRTLGLPSHARRSLHDPPVVRRKGTSFATLIPLFQRLPTVGVSAASPWLNHGPRRSGEKLGSQHLRHRKHAVLQLHVIEVCADIWRHTPFQSSRTRRFLASLRFIVVSAH